jgi:hypothetical protein
VYQLHWPKRKNYFGQRDYTNKRMLGKITFTLSWKLDGFVKAGKNQAYWVVKWKSMGNHAFWKKAKYNNLPRVKRFKIRIHWTVFFWKCFRWSLPERKCGFIGVFTNGILFYLENSNGWITSKHAYFIPQYSRYNSEQVLKLVCIMKLQLKRIDLDRTVFGIYRTTFCN